MTDDFVKRVVLIGAESTGKTTLAKRLAEEFDTVWMPEYGRLYTEERKLAGSDSVAVGHAGEWTTEDFEIIATIQQTDENRLAREANKVLICDTNATATAIWHERYMGFAAESVERIAAADIADLYLLSPPDTPFVQDGIRDGEDIREWMHERFRERMPDAVLLSGSWEERILVAKAAIERLGLVA